MLTTPEALAAELATAGAQAPAKARQAVVKTLVDIGGDAKTMAPVDTGFLRASHTWEMTGEFQGEVGPEAHYGRYVEEGTRHQAPQPYLRPAADRREAAFYDALDFLGLGVRPGR